MRRIRLILGTAVVVLAAMAGWQAGSSYLASLELQDDMHDLASQLAPHIGYSAPTSDDDLRAAILHKAQQYNIDLQPRQVTVQRSGSGYASTVYLAADYRVPVHVPGVSFTLHFTPSSAKTAF